MPLEYALQYISKFSEASPYKHPPVSKTVQTNDFGIQDMAHQIVHMTKRKPFGFNIMLCGESGLGKTTFINTLFNTDLLTVRQEKLKEPTQTDKLQPYLFELEEKGVKLHLTVVDTPGLTDGMNREDCLNPILEYINQQNEQFHAHETSQTIRKEIPDSRIHCILYFISPNTHLHMKELDVYALQTLSTRANVIPIIAKADTLTAVEKQQVKEVVLRDLAKYDVKVFPHGFQDEDDEDLSHLDAVVPFCVIGSNKTFPVKGGQQVRGRAYRWGIAEVENEKHCDFLQLRQLLMGSHLYSLIHTTHQAHYLNYRMQKLRSTGRPLSLLKSDEMFDSQLDETKKTFQQEIAQKEETMRRMFLTKIREKEAELREKEEFLSKKEKELDQELAQMIKQLEMEEKEIDMQLQQKKSKK